MELIHRSDQDSYNTPPVCFHVKWTEVWNPTKSACRLSVGLGDCIMFGLWFCETSLLCGLIFPISSKPNAAQFVGFIVKTK